MSGWVPEFGRAVDGKIDPPPLPYIFKKGGWRTMKRLKRGSFGDEWGRGGAVWAHTLGKRSHGLQEGFWRPPGPPGGYKKLKHVKNVQKS